MRCNNIRIRRICGMLYGCKIINAILARYDNDAARMLTGGAFNTYTGVNQAIRLGAIWDNATILGILHHKAIRRFGRKCTDGPCTKHIFRAKQLFCIFVHFSLDIAGEIQINIRRLIPIKAQKCFKRNIMSITHQGCAAVRTVLFR